jgi:hypothetical protein
VTFWFKMWLIVLLVAQFVMLFLLPRQSHAGESVYIAAYWDFIDLAPWEKREKVYVASLPTGTHKWTAVKYIDDVQQGGPTKMVVSIRYAHSKEEGMMGTAEPPKPIPTYGLVWHHAFFGPENETVFEPLMVDQYEPTLSATLTCKSKSDKPANCGGKLMLFAE